MKFIKLEKYFRKERVYIVKIVLYLFIILVCWNRSKNKFFIKIYYKGKEKMYWNFNFKFKLKYILNIRKLILIGSIDNDKWINF